MRHTSGRAVVIGVSMLFATAAAGAAQSSWDGVYTQDQATRGAAVYAAHCASCHGDAMTGGEAAPALTGVSFNATWESVPLADLFERMRMTMPPGKSGTVPRPGMADVLARMLQAAGMPAGKVELGSDRAALSSITFRSNKP